jgi:hypothetical protein
LDFVGFGDADADVDAEDAGSGVGAPADADSEAFAFFSLGDREGDPEDDGGWRVMRCTAAAGWLGGMVLSKLVTAKAVPAPRSASAPAAAASARRRRRCSSCRRCS